MPVGRVEDGQELPAGKGPQIPEKIQELDEARTRMAESEHAKQEAWKAWQAGN